MVSETEAYQRKRYEKPQANALCRCSSKHDVDMFGCNDEEKVMLPFTG